MDVPTKHQIVIAKKTLRLSDMGALIIGGMTKPQARLVLHDKAGWSYERIVKWETA